MDQMISFLIYIFAATISSAATAPTLENKFGSKMVVQYFIYNAGLHALVVQEKLESGELKEAQKIRMFLKKDEFLTNQYGFVCNTKDKAYVFAIASKKKAQRKKSFKPARGWTVDESDLSLNVISNPGLVSCKWSPEGNAEYPFKK